MDNSIDEVLFDHKRYFETKILQMCPKADVEKLLGKAEGANKEKRDQELCKRFSAMYAVVFGESCSDLSSTSTGASVDAIGPLLQPSATTTPTKSKKKNKNEAIKLAVETAIGKYRQAVREQFDQYKGLHYLSAPYLKAIHEAGVKAARSFVLEEETMWTFVWNLDCKKVLELLAASYSLEYLWIQVVYARRQLWPFEQAMSRMHARAQEQLFGDIPAKDSGVWFSEPDEINLKFDGVVQIAMEEFRVEIRENLKGAMKKEAVDDMEKIFKGRLNELRLVNERRRDHALEKIQERIKGFCALFQMHLERFLIAKPSPTKQELEKEKEDIIMKGFTAFTELQATNCSPAYQRRYLSEMRKGVEKTFKAFVAAREEEALKNVGSKESTDVESVNKDIQNLSLD